MHTYTYMYVNQGSVPYYVALNHIVDFTLQFLHMHSFCLWLSCTFDSYE